jgi:hypothetical protein
MSNDATSFASTLYHHCINRITSGFVRHMVHPVRTERSTTHCTGQVKSSAWIPNTLGVCDGLFLISRCRKSESERRSSGMTFSSTSEAKWTCARVIVLVPL